MITTVLFVGGWGRELNENYTFDDCIFVFLGEGTGVGRCQGGWS